MASIIVIENFYSDPHYIRERALAMEWSDDHGNHPGMRTLISDRDDSVKIALENAIGSNVECFSAESLKRLGIKLSLISV